jgi:hypothetical protein
VTDVANGRTTAGLVLSPGCGVSEDQPLAKPEDLPKRVYGTHLPPAAYREVTGRAKVPHGVYRTDEPAVRLLLNGLRRWS